MLKETRQLNLAGFSFGFLSAAGMGRFDCGNWTGK
jgi:hypothetical protein